MSASELDLFYLFLYPPQAVKRGVHMGQTTKIENAYNFISTHREFSRHELESASGWTPKTTEKNLWKIGDIVQREGKKYFPIDNFKNLVSLQTFKSKFSQTRLNKSYSSKQERLLQKSKQAVLSAVQMYNNPLTTFRTESFIVLMNIGFLSLFQSIFEKNKMNYGSGSGKTLNLQESFKLFHLNLVTSSKYEPVFFGALDAQIKYFQRIRNLIEHHIDSTLDVYTYGHCQAFLFCYEHILKTEFGRENSLNTMLTCAVQFSDDYSHLVADKALDDFHIKFYKEITDEVKGSPYFKLKVRIIPYKNVSEANLQQNAIFVNDPKLITKYAEMDNVFFVSSPTNLTPTEMAELVRPMIVKYYGDIKFGANHLAKIANYLGWVKNKKVVNNAFMADVKIGKKSRIRQYKKGAENKIQKELKRNPKAFLKSFAPKSFYIEWEKTQ